MNAMKKRPGSAVDIAQRQKALEQSGDFIANAGAALPVEQEVVQVTKEKVVRSPVEKPAAEKELRFPWDAIDDKTARTQGYTVNFPASTYAKLKFLGENLPGGPSVRSMVLEALEPYIAERLNTLSAKR